jgi:hypothetical protein
MESLGLYVALNLFGVISVFFLCFFAAVVCVLPGAFAGLSVVWLVLVFACATALAFFVFVLSPSYISCLMMCRVV